MSSPFLHIVSFNIPFPADYGGVIDIYFKLKALSQAGVRIILHCFEYGRPHSKELEDLCFKVYYYPRKKGLKYLFHSDPYIVTTRVSNFMPNNILGDPFPVLFEGLHTTGMLSACEEANKRTFVRTHNIEHDYYRGLAGSTQDPVQKLYFATEAGKLKRYEKVLRHADRILSIARHEADYFRNAYGEATFIPAFHRFEELNPIPGSGSYILYHGNLSVAENSEMFLILAAKHLSGIPFQVIVAGKGPPARFRKKLVRYPHIRLVADPTDAELDRLISQAHINLLFTRQATGIKLKLLHALYGGRHCLVNREMVSGSGLETLCMMAGTGPELNRQIHELMETPFGETEILKRKKALQGYSCRASAEKILRMLD
jgi:hypothetical protein